MNKRGLEILFLTSLTVVAVICFLSCAGTGARYIETPSTPPPETGISGSNSDLRVVLNCIICTDGPGSWVREAPWHEYIITVTTPPNKSLTINRVALIDPTGVQRVSGASPLQLRKASEELLKSYKRQGILAGATLGGMAASTAIPFIGPAFNAAGLAAQQSDMYASTKDQENINQEFARRSLPIPLSLSGNAHAKGSIFFPMIPNPRALLFQYRVGQDEKTLEIPLGAAKSQ